MKHAFAVFLAAAALAGCASPMPEIMQSWVGAPVDEVIARWGYPDEEKTIAGRTLLVWYREVSATLPGSATTTGSVIGRTILIDQKITPPTTLYGSCTRMLEVKGQVVVGWQAQGNNCPFATIAPPYSTWKR